MECGGWDRGSYTGVVVAGKAIGNQHIREFGKNSPNCVMTQLVKYVGGRVIRKVDRWLMWRSEPSPSGIAIISWRPNAHCRACDQMPQSVAEGCSHCQIHLLGEGDTCGREISHQIQVPLPELMSAMVRVCLAIWQQLMEGKLLLEN